MIQPEPNYLLSNFDIFYDILLYAGLLRDIGAYGSNKMKLLRLRLNFRLKRDTDMTTGSILEHLIWFALPLLVGNLFQILYNTVDSIVVGNFVSKQALAAVGGSGPIINTLVGIFSGLSSGATVVISQYYGARDNKHVSEAVHSTIALTAVLSVIFTIAGIVFTPTMLKWMAVPDDVMPEAKTYLYIYFAGVSGLMFYNMGTGILRAVGDSRRPTIFLVISAITNIVLDLVFVLILSMGTAGVAYATIISQFLSAVLVLLTLIRSDGSFRLNPKKVSFTWPVTVKMVNIGIPTSVQQAVTAFSNVFVNSYINVFGSAAMAGWSSYGKIDQFVLLPVMAMAFATTTFIGQNWGAGLYDRARKSLRIAMKLSLIMTVVLIPILIVFSRQFITLFNQEVEVLDYGSLMVRFMAPFYVLTCINQIYAGALRGTGNTRVPMIILLSSFVAFRQVYLLVISNLLPGQLVPVILGYPAGWLAASVLLCLYYEFGNWREKYKTI